MARIELAPEVIDDFDRFFERLPSHLAAYEVDNIPARIAEILDALQVLVLHPHIGRPAKGGKRELVIGAGSRGYVALYRFVAAADTVFVLAFRHQREAGYRQPR